MPFMRHTKTLKTGHRVWYETWSPELTREQQRILRTWTHGPEVIAALDRAIQDARSRIESRHPRTPSNRSPGNGGA